VLHASRFTFHVSTFHHANSGAGRRRLGVRRSPIAFAQRHGVSLWARDAAGGLPTSRSGAENLRYLPACPFPESLQVTSDLDVTLGGADLAILSAPLAGLRPLLLQLKALAPAMPFLWVCKGLEAGSGLLPHQVVAEVMGEAVCGVLTGPSFALEVARGLPTAVTLAAARCRLRRGNRGAPARRQPAHLCQRRSRRRGVGGAVKECPGDRHRHLRRARAGPQCPRAALITRGLAEITRFGER